MTGVLQGVVTAVLFFLILGLTVLVHELGHFVIARLARVRVLEFGVGFPPRAKVLRDRGETVYTLNWLPIGGFVKLEGEDGDEASDPRSFSRAPLPVRLLILVAGVAMNFLLSFVIFGGIALAGDPTFGVTVGGIQPGSPAEAAGIQPGDTLVSVNGESSDALGGPTIPDALRAEAGQPIDLGVERNGQVRTLRIVLRPAAVISPTNGALGVSQLVLAPTSATIGHDPVTAARLGVDRTVAATRLIIGGLGDLVNGIVNHPTQPPPASGPLGIAVQIGDVFWTLGPVFTLYLAGVLSANLGIVNILPVPALDGGRMVILTFKSLFGPRISLRAERLAYVVGYVFLFALIIWVTSFDLLRQFGLTQ
jgi:regulator of sigma E protease